MVSLPTSISISISMSMSMSMSLSIYLSIYLCTDTQWLAIVPMIQVLQCQTSTIRLKSVYPQTSKLIPLEFRGSPSFPCVITSISPWRPCNALIELHRLIRHLRWIHVALCCRYYNIDIYIYVCILWWLCYKNSVLCCARILYWHNITLCSTTIYVIL